MDIRVNDNAHALIFLKKMGINLAVVCSRSCSLKAKKERPEYEDMEGIPIYRIYRDFSEQSSYPVKQY
ncbi:unnamed protein product, partial [marine sediment metagenome]